MEKWVADNKFADYLEHVVLSVLMDEFLGVVLSDLETKCQRENIEFTREFAEKRLYTFIHKDLSSVIDYVLSEHLYKYFDREEVD